MNKKVIFTALLFIFLLIVAPLLQSFFFSHQSTGKIVINQSIDAPYLHNADKEYLLLFFGYVGCVKVCTPILHRLDAFYDSTEFSPLKPFVVVTFVNLMPELEQNQPQLFATSFNPEFEGVYLTQKELMGIDRQFSLFFSKSLSDPNELDHSDHLYLLQRQKNGELILKNIYTTHPLNKMMIIEDILALQKGKK